MHVCAVQVGLLLPLSVTGFVWALGCVLYAWDPAISSSPKSSSTPCVEHARVPRMFLGSYFGL